MVVFVLMFLLNAITVTDVQVYAFHTLKMLVACTAAAAS
jgi:hypothetical protein